MTTDEAERPRGATLLRAEVGPDGSRLDRTEGRRTR